MKLRKIGNSLGTTFSKDVLATAGFSSDQELDVIAEHGEIRIKGRSARVVVEFTPIEAKALAASDVGSKAGVTAVAKIKKILER